MVDDKEKSDLVPKPVRQPIKDWPATERPRKKTASAERLRQCDLRKSIVVFDIILYDIGKINCHFHFTSHPIINSSFEGRVLRGDKVELTPQYSPLTAALSRDQEDFHGRTSQQLWRPVHSDNR
ncbi:MAG: hypothetical protein V1844_18160 [Pseudomonadota bacterium]